MQHVSFHKVLSCVYKKKNIYCTYKHLCHSPRLLEYFAMGLIRPGPSRRRLERRWFLLVPFMLHPLMFALPKDSCLTPWLRAMSIYHDRMIQFTFCTMFSNCFLLYGPCYSGMLEHCRYNIILYYILLYYIILYYVMLCYVILYYIILYNIILYMLWKRECKLEVDVGENMGECSHMFRHNSTYLISSGDHWNGMSTNVY